MKTKSKQGIDWSLHNWGIDESIKKFHGSIHASEFKSLSVIATENYVHFSVKYTIEADNYSPNLRNFFKLNNKKSKPSIQSCIICNQSKIIIKNSQEGVDDLVIYDKWNDQTSSQTFFDKVKMDNVQDDLRLFFVPSNVDFQVESYNSDIYFQKEGILVYKFKYTGSGTLT